MHLVGYFHNQTVICSITQSSAVLGALALHLVRNTTKFYSRKIYFLLWIKWKVWQQASSKPRYLFTNMHGNLWLLYIFHMCLSQSFNILPVLTRWCILSEIDWFESNWKRTRIIFSLWEEENLHFFFIIKYDVNTLFVNIIHALTFQNYSSLLGFNTSIPMLVSSVCLR